MKLLNILTMLGLLFTPNLKPDTIQSIGGATTDVQPFYTFFDNEQVGSFSYSGVQESAVFNYAGMYANVEHYTKYTFLVSSFYVIDTDAPLYTDIIININYYGLTDPYYRVSDNAVWEFTTFSSDNAPSDQFDEGFLDILTLSSFDYSLIGVGNSLGNTISQYHIHTDLITGQYNYFIFRCVFDYSDILDDNETNFYDGITYNESVWDDVDYSNVYYENRIGYPQFILLNGDLFGSEYIDGYNAGRDSVNTQQYINEGYDYGYQDGVDSVNTTAIYDNGYATGYNAGLIDSSGSYGITELLYSIFNIPVLVLSNLLSFTIFGRDMWGLIVSIALLGVLIYLIRMIIKGSKPSD